MVGRVVVAGKFEQREGKIKIMKYIHLCLTLCVISACGGGGGGGGGGGDGENLSESLTNADESMSITPEPADLITPVSVSNPEESNDPTPPVSVSNPEDSNEPSAPPTSFFNGGNFSNPPTAVDPESPLLELDPVGSNQLADQPALVEPDSPVAPPDSVGSNEPSPPVDVVFDEEIVYVRVPRNHQEADVLLKDGETSERMKHLDVFDTLLEVGRMYRQVTAGGQLVRRYKDGTEEIIFDCALPLQPCIPTDPMFSLSGDKLAFAVYRTVALERNRWNGVTLPGKELSNFQEASSRIHIYDMETKELVAWDNVEGTNDMNPIWLHDDQKILFSSNNGGYIRPKLKGLNAKKRLEPRMFIANPDGTGRADISPHQLSGAVHPWLADNGRVVFSEHTSNRNLAYGTNNSVPNSIGTINNAWWLSDMNTEGGDYAVVLGGHARGTETESGVRKGGLALHWLGQLATGEICTGIYYRANNLGLGDIGCFMQLAKGKEGTVPDFKPEFKDMFEWSTSRDRPSNTDSQGKYLGKVGWPEGLPNRQMMLTFGHGRCSQVATSVPGTDRALEAANNVGCDTGIYMTTTLPASSKHPSDLVQVVDSSEWHEHSARVRQSRNPQVYPVNKTADGSCRLSGTSAQLTDAFNYTYYKKQADGTYQYDYSDYEFNARYKTMVRNATRVMGLDHERTLAGLRFYKLEGNLDAPSDFQNFVGNRVSLLGDVDLNADKSFSVELPCDTAYTMTGIDENGRGFLIDQQPQSLRPGEHRVCAGCHLHATDSPPTMAFAGSMADLLPPTKLLDTSPVTNFSEDIAPIIQGKCMGCHLVDGVPLTYEGLANDYKQELVPEDLKIVVSTRGGKETWLNRPLRSKYIDTISSRRSLLQWKVENERLDGWNDYTHAKDIDFGADHPTNLTSDEMKLFARWIDGGAERGPMP